MLKKMISVLLALCVLFLCLLPAAAAGSNFGVISVRLNSDIAGLTKDDAEKLIEIRSDNVVYKTGNGGPVFFADYGGTAEDGALVAGRTYTAYYSLEAADGYTLPDILNDNDVQIECGKGVSVISTQILSAKIRGEDGNFKEYREVRIFAQVVVDGNIFQRVIGMIHDLILKIKAWSLD